MRVVVFNWRDRTSARSGGAEYSTHALAAGLAARGHTVTWFTSRPPGLPAFQESDGYVVARAGSEVSCRFYAARWLRKNRQQLDVVVDEVNTLPFFSPFIVKSRTVLWIHQLAQEVWNAEAPFPIGALGRFAEKYFMRVYRDIPAVTVSKSSAQSLRAAGLRAPVHVVENPLLPPAGVVSHPQRHLLGYVGRITRSKRVDHVLRALAQVRAVVPDARLEVAGKGDERELRRLRQLASDLDIEPAVTFHGMLSDSERDRMMQRLDVLCLSSVREGWGLVVSEAARFGVPSVVYPVPGLVDSVAAGETGIVVDREDPAALAAGVLALFERPDVRDRLGRGAMRFIEPFTAARFVERFEGVLVERAATAARAESRRPYRHQR